MKEFEINCETKYYLHRHYIVFAYIKEEAWEKFLKLRGGSRTGYKNIEINERKGQIDENKV